MKKIILSTIACTSLLLAANSKYEISPMFGVADYHHNLTLKDNSSYGATLGINNSKDSAFDQLELAWFGTSGADYKASTKSTSINRILVSGVKNYEVADKTSLYALIGGGYEKISTEENDIDSEFVANIGVGIKYKISDAIALKAEAREVIRKSDEHTTLWHLGLAIPFGEEAAKVVPMVEKEKPMVEKEKPMVAEVIDGDDDEDGVLNSMDKCPTTAEGVHVDTTGCESVNMSTKLIAHFDFDKSVIRTNDQIDINEYVSYLKKFPKSKIVIEGHTDSVGSMAYNDKLGIRRALKIRDEIIAQGISKKRIRVEYYGETMPVIDNETPENRAANRRSISRIIR